MADDAKTNRVTLQIDGIEGALAAASVRIEERISDIGEITVTLASDTGVVRPQAVLRKGAQVDVTSGGTLVRRFEGFVIRVREAWRGPSPAFTITIALPLYFMTLSSDCRIFQDMTVPEIVEKVITEARFPAERIVQRLSATYPKLESCTQYRETMFAFVSRLLEQNGAFFFFENGDEGLNLVLADAPDAHRPATPASLPWVVDQGLLTGPAVTSLTEVEALRPTKVTLRDYDWKRPDLDLEASSERSAKYAREVYDHPGGYAAPREGTRRAKFRLEAIVAAGAGITGNATAPGLSAGSTFDLANGPRDDLAKAWVVTEATHSWTATAGAGSWSCFFRAIPKTVPFRKPTATPCPKVAGPHTAFVTGPSGQEIHTDPHGRVRLKFLWDRRAAFDEKSSPWVRVAELAMSGAVAIPRIGWEVLVEFEHGDPDRPVVVGRLFNGIYLPPYALPGRKAVSTLLSFSSPKGEGHNEIRIDDAADAEHIHMHAQKDLELKVAHDRKAHVTTSRGVTIKADEQITVKGNRSLTVKGLSDVTVAGSQTLAVEGDRKKTIKKDEKITVDLDRKLTVTGSHTIATEANATLGVGGDVASTINGTLTESADEATSVLVGDDMTMTVAGAKSETAKKGKTSMTDGKRTMVVGGAFVDVSGKDRSILVGGKRTSTVGAAWTVTSSADVELSSRGALEITVGAALTMTGATGISFKVGGSKVLIGQGGVVLDSAKVKVTSDGPAALLGALVGSK
jgi:type VI secretion system secreted protein VgrG